MSSDGKDRPRLPRDLSPVTLGLASLGSAAATVLVSRFGLAGTVIGAALAPVIVTLVREAGRRPVERVVQLPTGAKALVERRPRLRWRPVAITSAAAFAVAVVVFTVPDLIAGESVVSERPSTFFSPRRDEPGPPAADPSRRPETEERTSTAPTTTAPPATTTTEPVAPEAPTTTVAPDPAAPPAQDPAPAPPAPTPPEPAPAPPAPAPPG